MNLGTLWQPLKTCLCGPPVVKGGSLSLLAALVTSHIREGSAKATWNQQEGHRAGSHQCLS
eukprot:scaffold108062_cov16-Tisochrysis_lutea.AAC.1